MRSIKSVALACVLSVFVTTAVSAKVTSRVVSFGQDFTVGGTKVKAGTYKLTFDDKTGEFTVVDRKTKGVIAKATGRLEKRQGATGGMDVKMDDVGDSHVITSVAFPGEPNTIQLSESQSASSGS